MKSIRKSWVAVAMAAVAVGTSGAFAGTYTPVNMSGGSEPDVIKALGVAFQNTYGLGVGLNEFTGAVNGTLTSTSGTGFSFVRVADAGGDGSALSIHGTNYGTADDNVFQDGTTKFKLQIGYTGGLPEKVGLALGDSGGTFSDLFTTTSTTPGATSEALGLIPNGGKFRVGATEAGNTANYFSSKASENGALDHDATHGGDHFVTYALLDKNSSFVSFFLCFEDNADTSPFAPSDYDYNDLIIQMKAVPLPASVWMGGALLGLAAGYRRFVKR